MKNSTANVGKRIRDVRLSRSLTQSELCGTELTRNHLSLIESGKSLPSLKNICYIADRLDIPVGYFFSDDENEDARFANFLAIDEIKKAYEARDFQKCIILCEAVPERLRSDEIQMLYAKCKFTASLSSAEKYDISPAVILMRAAADAAAKSAYLSRDFLSATKYYEALYSSLTEQVIPAILTDIHEISSYVHPELVMYMKLVAGETLSDDIFASSRHRQHAEALHLIAEGNTLRAYSLLVDLSELSSLPFYMRFRVYDDLERCANEIGEFKTAYSAARHKLELLGK